MTLHIADGFSLGDEFVTKTCAIVAQRRKGKTYSANVLAEELVAAGLPWVALDPTGAWWGLRSSADGTREGLPVVVLGGQHGDAPLDRTSGRVVAELVVEHPGWYVLDMSLFESKGAEREFSADFAEALYRRKGQPGRDFPLHLFVDEADMFVPQERESADSRMLGAFQSIVRRGGLRGLGTTLISQRPALVNKSVLVQLDMLIVLRLVAGNDQDYVKKNYFERAGTKEQVVELMASMARLALGEAWVWEPGEDIFERIQVRERRTFNSSITPKPGEVRIEPTRLATVDLDAVKDVMASAIQKAKDDDPGELRRTIAALQRELKEARIVPPKPEPIEVEVEVPVIAAADLEALESAAKQMATITDALSTAVETLVGATDAIVGAVEGTFDDWQDVPRARPASDRPDPVGDWPRTDRAAQRPDPPRRLDAGSAPVPRPPETTDVVVKAGAKRILQSLGSLHPDRLTESQIGTLAKLRKGGTRDTYMSTLRRGGLIVKGDDSRYSITEAGFAYLGGDVPAPATPEQLLDMWRDKLKAGARRMLDLLVEAYTSTMSRDALGAAVDLESSGGTFGTYLSTLRRNGLVEDADGEVRASPTLFQR